MVSRKTVKVGGAVRRKAPAAIGRPTGSNREQTIPRVLASALSCFTAKGFAGTTFKEIAAGAGITGAAVYQYFDSKAMLYVAVLDDIFSELLPRFEQAVAASDNLMQQLRNLVDAMVSLHEQYPERSAFLSSVPIESRRNHELHDIFAHRASDMRALQTGMIEAAKKRGDIDPDRNTENYLMVFFGSIAGMAQYQLSVDGTSLREAADIYLDMMEARLFPRRRARPKARPK